jgi:hypothetical protein
MIILYILLLMQPYLTDQTKPEVFFEYKSQGTYSRLEFHVKVFTDRTIHYAKSGISPAVVLEEWMGSLSEADYKTFVSEITETCKFMELPDRIEEPIRIKDSSIDEISVLLNSKKHSIGGYGASHYEKYTCIYMYYNKMLFSVTNIKYRVKPKL